MSVNNPAETRSLPYFQPVRAPIKTRFSDEPQREQTTIFTTSPDDIAPLNLFGRKVISTRSKGL